MVLGLLLIAMTTGAVTAGAVYAYTGSFMLAFVSYSAAGALIMLVGMLAIGLGRRKRHEAGSAQDIQSQRPVQHTTTPTVASRTFKSVSRDSLRS